jgi:uncharacterized small protein (DUF1192 family)
MKKLYQPYSVPAMADPAPLEKRLRHILFGRGGYTLRHAAIPLILGIIALGALLPLRPKPSSTSATLAELPASDVAVATDAQPAQPAIAPESTEELERRAAELEAELARTRQELAERTQQPGLRTFRVPYRTPADGKMHRVVVQVEDAEGRHTGYTNTLGPSSLVHPQVQGMGRPITIRLYDNDDLKASSTVRR